MKKLLIGLGFVVALLIVAVLALPLLVPADTVKAKVIAQLSKATGRQVTVTGPVSVSAFPSLGLQIGGLTLGNAPGGQAKEMVSLDGLKAELKVMPLLSGKIEVDSFVLTKPVIHLEVDKAGKPNWVFASAGSGKAEPGKAAEPAPESSGGGAPTEISLGKVVLKDGLLSYLDQRSGAKQEVSAINLTVSLPSLDHPFKADGALTWNGKAIDIDLAADQPRALLDGKPSPVSILVKGEPLALAFKGTAALANAVKADGPLSLTIPSVRALAAWAGGAKLPDGPGYGPASLQGTLAVQGDRYALSKASLNLDQIAAAGDLSADLSGKPQIKAVLAVPMLDVTPYMGGGSEGSPAASGTAPSAPAPAQKSASAGDEGWSTDPIDLTGLKAVDADLTVTADAIKADKIAVGKSTVKAVLKGGHLNADVQAGDLYGGKGHVQAAVDGSRPGLNLNADWTLSGLQAQPFLTAAADFKRLSGTLDSQGTVTGSGRSLKDFIGVLGGKGAAKFTDGAISGINLGAMVRNVTTAFTAGGEAQKTDFAELSATWTIAQGIVSNNDLALLSPLLRITGAGTVSLPPRTLNYRVEPKAVASAEGQGGAKELGGITVPVVIEGPWSNLSYRPDLGAAAKQKVTDKVMEKLGDKADTPAGQMLKGLLGQ